MDLLRLQSPFMHILHSNYGLVPPKVMCKGRIAEIHASPMQVLRNLPRLGAFHSLSKSLFEASCASNGSFSASGTETFSAIDVDEHDCIPDAIIDYNLLLKTTANELVKDLKGTCIFLIGMMGSGKSTVGRILGEALGYYFFDSDKLVEQAAGGASVSEIFKEKNEEGFRDVETEVLKQLSCNGRLVVATGGGIVVRPINWSYLRHGITVWLDVPLEALAKRVVDASVDSRPLLEVTASDYAYNQALESLGRILDERGSSYADADARVSLQNVALRMGYQDVSSITPTMIAIEVLKEIKKLVQHRKGMDKAAGA